jgi:L-ascorbate metabolism protein UlaG (beta-lactamase superfamily)
MSLQVTYVGHATVLIELDDARLLTDPLLRRRVTHLFRRVELDTSGMRELDAVLISHGHYDHLDLRSLALLDRQVQVLVPRGYGHLAQRRGFANVAELDVGDQRSVGPVQVTATPAEHDGRRRPLGVKARALGYLVRGSTSVYFAGDTDLFPELEALGDVDVALLPVAGWGPTLPPGHLDPSRAAEAARRVRPRIAIPIHWGTYGSPGTNVTREPADAFAAAVRDVAPEVEVRVLAPGERVSL